MEDKRSFTLIKAETSSGHIKGKANLGGRFVSSNPASAAKKAASQLCKASKIKGRCVHVVTIKETTKGSKGKEYVYKVSRVYDPVTVVRAGEEITYKYKTIAKAM